MVRACGSPWQENQRRGRVQLPRGSSLACESPRRHRRFAARCFEPEKRVISATVDAALGRSQRPALCAPPSRRSRADRLLARGAPRDSARPFAWRAGRPRHRGRAGRAPNAGAANRALAGRATAARRSAGDRRRARLRSRLPPRRPRRRRAGTRLRLRAARPKSRRPRRPRRTTGAPRARRGARRSRRHDQARPCGPAARLVPLRRATRIGHGTFPGSAARVAPACGAVAAVARSLRLHTHA